MFFYVFNQKNLLIFKKNILQNKRLREKELGIHNHYLRGRLCGNEYSHPLFTGHLCGNDNCSKLYNREIIVRRGFSELMLH